ncbi:MAG: hypothetical protein NXH95_02455 [Pseudomonadaceae bacterium]|nr:hypothetical protein [Pseudomonadaceae bacterium]
MTVELSLSPWRVYLAILWVGYMSWVSFFWLGFAGVGLVCVCSTRLMRRQMYRLSRVSRRIYLQEDNIRALWQLGGLMCIRTYAASHWIFPGELQPGQRAALRIFLLEQVPRQAEGLRISS